MRGGGGGEGMVAERYKSCNFKTISITRVSSLMTMNIWQLGAALSLIMNGGQCQSQHSFFQLPFDCRLSWQRMGYTLVALTGGIVYCLCGLLLMMLLFSGYCQPSDSLTKSHQGLAGEGAAGHMSSPLQVFMAATSAWSNWWVG